MSDYIPIAMPMPMSRAQTMAAIQDVVDSIDLSGYLPLTGTTSDLDMNTRSIVNADNIAASSVDATTLYEAGDSLSVLYSRLSGGNTFTGNQVVTGNITASGSVTVGTDGQVASSAGSLVLAPFSGRIYLGSVGALSVRDSLTLGMASNTLIAATSATNNSYSAAIDATISRAGPGAWQLGTTAANALGSLNLSSLIASGAVRGASVWIGGGTNTRLYGPASGQLGIYNNTETAGVGFDVTTDGVLAVRNKAQNADGSVTCANLTASGTLACGTAAFNLGSGVDFAIDNPGGAYAARHRVSGTARTEFGLYQFKVNSSYLLQWSNSGSNITTVATTLSQVSPGVLQIGTTAPNALGSLNLTNLNAAGTHHTVAIGVANVTFDPNMTVGQQLLFTTTMNSNKVAIGFDNSGTFKINQVAFGPVIRLSRVEATGIQGNYAPAFQTDITSGQEKGMFSESGNLYLSVNRLNQLAVTPTGVSISGTITSSNGKLNLRPTASTNPGPVYLFDTIDNLNNGSHVIASFRANGAERFAVSTGQVTIGTTLAINGFVSHTLSNSSAAFRITNTAGPALAFGGVTAGNVALAYSGTTLQVKTGDNSASAPLSCSLVDIVWNGSNSTFLKYTDNSRIMGSGGSAFMHIGVTPCAFNVTTGAVGPTKVQLQSTASMSLGSTSVVLRPNAGTFEVMNAGETDYANVRSGDVYINTDIRQQRTAAGDTTQSVYYSAGAVWQDAFRQIASASGAQLGFYGVTPVARQSLPTNPTTAQIATVLGNLGLALLT